MKESNPKDAIGADKLPLHLWPPAATAMGCIGLAEGATKYGRANWRAAGIRASIYYDACRRHLDAWFEGEEVAPDSDVPHLANALACLAIIVDAKAVGKLVDDRNYRGEGYRALVEALTPHVARLKELHADKAPKHWDRRENDRIVSAPDYHHPLPWPFEWGRDAPTWARWFAFDENGDAHWFSRQPVFTNGKWVRTGPPSQMIRAGCVDTEESADHSLRQRGQSELPAQD